LNVLQSQTKGETPDRFGEMPLLVNINGIPFWQASGRTFPVVAGAEDPPPGGANNDDGDADAESDDSADDYDKDRAFRTIQKQRADLKAVRERERIAARERDELKAKQRERDEAELSETERLKARAAELEREKVDLERERQEARNVRAVEKAATKHGAADPEDVFKLLDSSKFEHDSDGNLINAEDLVKTLLKDKPYLAGKGTNGVPGTPRSNGTQSHEDRVKENEQKLRASGLYGSIG
jgi:hypothetical protein